MLSVPHLEQQQLQAGIHTGVSGVPARHSQQSSDLSHICMASRRKTLHS